MPTIAQMKVRQGNLADLPVLQPGEFGYALDQQRLYIGNTPVSQAGDGTTTLFTFPTVDTDNDGTTDNNVTLSFGSRVAYAVYIDNGTTELYNRYRLYSSHITLYNCPRATETVKVYYNTEVMTSLSSGSN